MSADNVTPIRPGSEPPDRTGGHGDNVADRLEFGFARGESHEPTSLRLWQALGGVCRAMEGVSFQDDPDSDEMQGLATAANVLAQLLNTRWLPSRDCEPGAGSSEEMQP